MTELFIGYHLYFTKVKLNTDALCSEVANHLQQLHFSRLLHSMSQRNSPPSRLRAIGKKGKLAFLNPDVVARSKSELQNARTHTRTHTAIRRFNSSTHTSRPYRRALGGPDTCRDQHKHSRTGLNCLICW